jgi:hypothetical protein
MKTLTVVGTAAMFLVGGGILAHGLPPVHHGIEQVAATAGALGSVVSLALDAAVGIVGGALALLGMQAFGAARKLVTGGSQA